jgi:uncharacterized sulfatase
MINNGHSPYIRELKDGRLKFVPKLKSSNNEIPEGVHYVTDFLTDKSLEILERDKSKPFCLMLSIPDPHTPNVSREPYTSMYKDMEFQIPQSMSAIKTIERPDSGKPKNKNEAEAFDQDYLRNYFGMVKSIDDNVGRILNFLKENNLEENTIVVFTSDHGDMLFEHHRNNKGVPYEASAKIPFIIKYPKKIKLGKVINTAYTTADFAPTILALMDAKPLPKVHGIDDSKAFESEEKIIDSNRITHIRTAGGFWVMAISDRYKLVISKKEEPWLFDLEKDPNELYNMYAKPEYKAITTEMIEVLKKQMKTYGEPAYQNENSYQFK